LSQSFSKDERLSSHDLIGRLFKRGSADVQTFYLFPFRVLYLYAPDSPPALPQVLFSISRRQFKKAVDRNLIRRRCREAYRLHKTILLQVPAERRPAYIAFLYLAKEKSDYDVIEKAMIKVLTRMAKSAPQS
jgi:ribonuclease P protein component